MSWEAPLSGAARAAQGQLGSLSTATGTHGCVAGASCPIWPSLTATLDLHLLLISIRLKRNSTTPVLNLPSPAFCPMRAVDFS